MSTSFYRINSFAQVEKLHEEFKGKILESLRAAEKIFLKSITVSSTGADNRSLFFLLYTWGFLKLLVTDVSLFEKKQRHGLEDVNGVFRDIGIDLFTFLGWIKKEYSTIITDKQRTLSLSELSTVMTSILTSVHIYENSVLSRHYIPNIKYSFSCLLWDFAPILTVGICKQILIWLKEARMEAEKLVKNQIGIFSFAHFFDEFQTAEDFIDCIDITIKTITGFISEDTLKEEDTYILEGLSKIKLAFLPIDKKMEPVLVNRNKHIGQ